MEEKEAVAVLPGHNGANVADVTVCFTAAGAQTLYVNGKLHSDMFGCDKTDASGNVTATIRRTIAGMTTLTATVARPCGTGQTTRKIDVWFGEPAEAVVVFCIDVTNSMTEAGGVSGAKAIGPIVDLINDLRTSGVSLKLGGVKFQDVIHSRHPLTQDVDEFIDWLEQAGYTHPYPGGGDDPENQLQALVEAAKMATGQQEVYIALATDNRFHDNTYGTDGVTALKRDEVISLLQGTTGCKVYIDPANYTEQYTGWPFRCDYDNSDPDCPNYDPNNLFTLAVDGAIEGDLGTYTFPNLRAAIAPP